MSSDEHNQHINKFAKHHFDNGSFVIVSDVSLLCGTLYFSSIILKKENSFCVTGATTKKINPSHNKEIIGACLALDYFQKSDFLQQNQVLHLLLG
jgi:hypothetical protein